MAIAFAKSVPQTNSQQSKCDDLLPQDQKMCLNKVILPPPPPQILNFFSRNGPKNPKKEEGISESIFFS